MTTGSNHFPTPIFQNEVPGFAEQNEKLYALVNRLKSDDPAGSRRSNLGGWRSAETLDVRLFPEVADVKKVIMETVTFVVAGMGFEGLGLALSEAWFVVSPSGAQNLRHCHPRSFLSGTYYIKAPPGSSPLYFHDPRPVKLYGTPTSPSFKVTPYTSEMVTCQIREGLLVLFPGWLEHRVPPHQAEGERVVLSFNFAVV